MPLWRDSDCVFLSNWVIATLSNLEKAVVKFSLLEKTYDAEKVLTHPVFPMKVGGAPPSKTHEVVETLRLEP